MKELRIRFYKVSTWSKLLALSTAASQRQGRRVSMNEIINDLVNEQYKILEQKEKENDNKK